MAPGLCCVVRPGAAASDAVEIAVIDGVVLEIPPSSSSRSCAKLPHAADASTTERGASVRLATVEATRELCTVARPDGAASDTVAVAAINGSVLEMCTSPSSLSCVDSLIVASEATRMGLSRVEPSSCGSTCGSSSTRIGLLREPDAERYLSSFHHADHLVLSMFGHPSKSRLEAKG